MCEGLRLSERLLKDWRSSAKLGRESKGSVEGLRVLRIRVRLFSLCERQAWVPAPGWHSGRLVHLVTVGTEEGQTRGPGRQEEVTAESWEARREL